MADNETNKKGASKSTKSKSTGGTKNKKFQKSKFKGYKSASAAQKSKMQRIQWKKGTLFTDVPFTTQSSYPDELTNLRRLSSFDTCFLPLCWSLFVSNLDSTVLNVILRSLST